MVDVFTVIQVVANIFVPDDNSCSPCEFGALKQFNCDCTTSTINCENREMKSLPTLEGCTLQGITDLNFANNRISSVQSEAFKGLQIKSSGKGLDSFKLDLSNNRISQIDKGSLRHLGKFTHIDLSNNRLDSSSFEGDFSSLRGLKELDLVGNSMEKVPVQFCQIPNLQTIHVQGNPGAIYKDTNQWRSVSQSFLVKHCNSNSHSISISLSVCTTFSLLSLNYFLLL